MWWLLFSSLLWAQTQIIRTPKACYKIQPLGGFVDTTSCSETMVQVTNVSCENNSPLETQKVFAKLANCKTNSALAQVELENDKIRFVLQKEAKYGMVRWSAKKQVLAVKKPAPVVPVVQKPIEVEKPKTEVKEKRRIPLNIFGLASYTLSSQSICSGDCLRNQDRSRGRFQMQTTQFTFSDTIREGAKFNLGLAVGEATWLSGANASSLSLQNLNVEFPALGGQIIGGVQWSGLLLSAPLASQRKSVTLPLSDQHLVPVILNGARYDRFFDAWQVGFGIFNGWNRLDDENGQNSYLLIGKYQINETMKAEIAHYNGHETVNGVAGLVNATQIRFDLEKEKFDISTALVFYNFEVAKSKSPAQSFVIESRFLIGEESSIQTRIESFSVEKGLLFTNTEWEKFTSVSLSYSTRVDQWIRWLSEIQTDIPGGNIDTESLKRHVELSTALVWEI